MNEPEKNSSPTLAGHIIPEQAALGVAAVKQYARKKGFCPDIGAEKCASCPLWSVCSSLAHIARGDTPAPASPTLEIVCADCGKPLGHYHSDGSCVYEVTRCQRHEQQGPTLAELVSRDKAGVLREAVRRGAHDVHLYLNCPVEGECIFTQCEFRDFCHALRERMKEGE